MYVCVCMCVLLCRRTSINRWGTSNTNRTKENNVRHVVYLAIGKHNFYVLLTRMSRFEFRDYQQCWSFFFFFFSAFDFLMLFDSRDTKGLRTRLTVKLSRVYIFPWIPRMKIIDILCTIFIFIEKKKIELFFTEIFVDKFLFFFGMIIRQ